jgi:hypothetical protein
MFKHHYLAAVGSFLVLAMAFILLVVGICWMTYPYKTSEVLKTEIITPIVQQGDLLLIANTYTKWTDKEAEVFRTFEGPLMYGIPTVTTNLPIGTHRILREVLIPNGLPPGNYHIHTKLGYHMNPLKTEIVEYETPDFKVIKSTQ